MPKCRNANLVSKNSDVFVYLDRGIIHRDAILFLLKVSFSGEVCGASSVRSLRKFSLNLYRRMPHREGRQKGGRLGAWVSFCFRGFLHYLGKL